MMRNMSYICVCVCVCVFFFLVNYVHVHHHSIQSVSVPAYIYRNTSILFAAVHVSWTYSILLLHFAGSLQFSISSAHLY